jgi:serine protease
MLKQAVLGLVLGATAATVLAAPSAPETNPYAPSYDHPYRHGVVPTREVHEKMKAWEKAHAVGQATSTNTLFYRGGTSSSNQGNVGVANGRMKVYLVFYGTGWGTQSTNANGDAVFSGDASGAAVAAQEMFKGIGTGGELWSAELTQWCQGASSGVSSCPGTTAASNFVPYMSGGILAGVWEDTSATTPINATGHTLALEAIKAAQHFGNTTPASNRYAYYVIMSAHGDDPDNYKSPTQGYCAWHDWNGDTSLSGGAASSSVGDIAFSNQPYNIDMGASCGVGFVNSPGTLDGWTMTLGHEWHETASDYFPAGGWTANSGYENSDECAWIAAGSAGGAANVAMGTGTFTEQASWSNDTNNCAISHAIVSHGGTVTVTASNGSVSTAQNTPVNGTLSASDSAGNAISFAIVANPAHGSVTINNLSTGAFTYTPASGYAGSDSFTFKATDSVTGTVSNTATESETVTSTVNHAPVASNGSVTTTTGTAVNGTLSASDQDGNALTFSVVTAPAHGTVTITNASTGAFTYTPASGYSGSDSFTFKANDGQVDSNTATESVTVNAAGGCATGYTSYTGNITQGSDVYEPNGTYYQTTVSGTNSGILSGPSGKDFDLYLYKWNGSRWAVVASSTGSTANETINYSGTAGYYEWDIYAYSGSGAFSLCLKHP